MLGSEFHHVSRVTAFVAEMFNAGKVGSVVITLTTGTRLTGQLWGTSTGGQNNSVKLLTPSGEAITVDMREIADIQY